MSHNSWDNTSNTQWCLPSKNGLSHWIVCSCSSGLCVNRVIPFVTDTLQTLVSLYSEGFFCSTEVQSILAQGQWLSYELWLRAIVLSPSTCAVQALMVIKPKPGKLRAQRLCMGVLISEARDWGVCHFCQMRARTTPHLPTRNARSTALPGSQEERISLTNK